MTQEVQETAPKTILNKNYKWSWYTFGIDLFSYTTLNLVVIILMILQKTFKVDSTLQIWVIVLVGVLLELLFVGFSVIDSSRSNPNSRLYSSSIFNLPVLSITILFAVAIFWNNEEVFAIAYGTLCGAFAGYLAGGLAYANFFIKIKDTVYRTIFGGCVGTFLGGIFGGLFAGLMDFQNYFIEDTWEYSETIAAQIFSGLFMGFWGGAIASGIIAVVLLYLLKEKTKFTSFFTKIMHFGVQREITADLKKYFKLDDESAKKDSKVVLKLEDIFVLKPEEQKELNRFFKIIREIAYFISPWSKEIESKRQQTFSVIIDSSLEELPLNKKDDKIVHE
ncbi:MAG: hypothetical protein ACTSPM_03205 [Candidatus Heimdallarchaeota archaeon]